MLLNCINGRIVIARSRCANVRRLLHVATGKCDDLPWHRGREEHRLAVSGQLRNDALDVGKESHVEHFVGFVENEDANL